MSAGGAPTSRKAKSRPARTQASGAPTSRKAKPRPARTQASGAPSGGGGGGGTPVGFRCERCKVTLNSETTLRDHLNGKRHKANMAACRRCN